MGLKEIIIFVIPFAVSAGCALLLIPQMVLTIPYRMSTWAAGKGVLKYSKKVRVGGINVFPILLLSLCLTLLAPYMLGYEQMVDYIILSTPRIIQIIIGLAILFLVGGKDDFNGASMSLLVCGLFVAALLFPVTELWVTNLHGLLGIHELPAWVGKPLTLLFVMYITFMFKILDGIDGLASGLVMMETGLFVACSVYKGFAIASIVSSCTFGLALVYWGIKYFDKRNEKTILGTAGALTFGYIISYLIVGMSRQSGGSLPENMLAMCLSTITLPFFDVIRVLVSRIRDSRGLLAIDRNQINHKLIRAGMSRSMSFFTLFLITMGITLTTTYMVIKKVDINIILLFQLGTFVLVHGITNYCISHSRNDAYRHSWEKTYGEEVWDSEGTQEILDGKREAYGTLDLPPHIVAGMGSDFIPDGMSGFSRMIKRFFDWLVATCCLIVFSPLFLICYLLIKLDDGGPAIYRQERMGRFGRPFDILKFRTMRIDAEKMGPQLSHSGGDDDPRLTKVGKFLRAHHLDELPQLWNVFLGEMSFIGYRPERLFYIQQISEIDPRYAFLYQIRPGVTSYATLYNGYTDTMEKMQRRLELDLYYLAHRSFLLDARVLFLTFLSIVAGKKF